MGMGSSIEGMLRSAYGDGYDDQQDVFEDSDEADEQDEEGGEQEEKESNAEAQGYTNRQLQVARGAGSAVSEQSGSSAILGDKGNEGGGRTY